ncbi:hypothetical protein PMAYCL1PPCAC_30003, partial [Pristionchus mayeri]
DWEAAEPRKDLIVLYDEMKSNGLFQRLKQVNMLDCRPAEEFDGRNPLAFPPNGTLVCWFMNDVIPPLSSQMHRSSRD